MGDGRAIAAPAVTVSGFRELQRALKVADKETRKGVKSALVGVAEPIKQDAEHRAPQQISGLRGDAGRSNSWAAFRIGVTQKVVYVAPKQRGRRSPRRRPNLAPLLMDRVMQPALDANRYRLEHDVGEALDKMADNFNHGGVL